MTQPARQAMDFRILGPVEATRNGRRVVLGPPKQRTLLALLVLRLGRAVSIDWLADQLWSGNPPARFATAIRNYASGLRKAMRVTDNEVLVTRAPGYLLDADPGCCDAVRFERLLDSGRELRRAGSPAEAGVVLREALDTWRGPALADVATTATEAEATRLEELHLVALEERIEADLDRGLGAGLAGELENLVARHPLRERLVGQHMRALYRSGRQADALQALATLRERLTSDLGIDPSPELRELERAILRQELDLSPRVAEPPTLRRAAAGPRVGATPFVGRRRELAELSSLLGSRSLVTLTGPGGVGKTRLAEEAAAAGSGPVWWVDLAPLGDPALVVREVAGVLAVVETPDRPLLDAVIERLSLDPSMLVLDNCEHLVSACAALADSLVRASAVTILATSREPLGVAAEQVYRVPPLPVDGDGDEPSEAERLFMDRARRARASFEAERVAVREICRRLDGLPLAIELAAGRVDVLGVDDISARLGLHLLEGGPRTARPAHRTMRAAIAWSHDSLDDGQRMLFRRLAVFAGGFGLAEAEGVCSGDGLDRKDVLRTLTRLISASLVAVRHRGATSRYHMLETIRELAAEELEAAGEVDALYGRLVEVLKQRSPRPSSTAEELEDEVGNVRAALRWAIERGRDPQSGLQLVLDWEPMWVRGRLTEAQSWIIAALDAIGPHGEPKDRAWGLAALSYLAGAQGELDQAAAFARDAVDLARRSGAAEVVAPALAQLGAVEFQRGHLDDGIELLSEARGLAAGARDDGQLVRILAALGQASRLAGDDAAAGSLLEEALTVARRVQDVVAEAVAQCYLGDLARARRDVPGARHRYASAIAVAERAAHPDSRVLSLSGLGACAAEERDIVSARRYWEQGLEVAREAGLQRLAASTLISLGVAEAGLGDPWRAKDHFEDGRLIANRLGDSGLAAAAATGLADLLIEEGSHERAAAHLAFALRTRSKRGEAEHVAACLESTGALAAAVGSAPVALRFLDESDRRRAALGYRRTPAEQARFDRAMAACAGQFAAPEGPDAVTAAMDWLAEAASEP